MEPQFQDEPVTHYPIPQPSYADVIPRQDLSAPTWGVPLAFANWFGSLIIGQIFAPLVLIVLYGAIFDRQILRDAMNGKETPNLILVSLVGVFIGLILTLITSWFIVTEMGKKPFFTTLGWSWHEKFGLGHAIGAAILMLLLSIGIEQILPHKATSMDKFLTMGFAVRMMLAMVASFGAPLVEEVIYRGVLYDALERNNGIKVALPVVTLLFWGVHVAQYYQSIAVLAAVLLLSFVLTYVRAYTKQLLPCVVIHTIFNGIQGVFIILAPQKISTDAAPAQPAFMLLQELGKHIGVL